MMLAQFKDLEEHVYKVKILPILHKDVTGRRYVVQRNIDELNLSNNELLFTKKLLNSRNIDIVEEITKEDRPTKVKDFEYGSITEAKLNHADIPVMSTIKFDSNGEIEYADFSRLDEFLEEEFIPEIYIGK